MPARRNARKTPARPCPPALKRLGSRARKGLGQHFLLDRKVLRRIMAVSGLSDRDTVIEVGPGLGFLTGELVKKAGRVISVEIDPVLAVNLPAELGYPPNLAVVNRDILSIPPAGLLPAGTAGYKVVANLPYYITAPVLRHFLEAEPAPVLMVVMVQKEVAEAITARPGRMSLLAVAVQVYARASIAGNVSAASFYPVPGVDASIVKIDVHPEPKIPASWRQGFFRLVRAGFSAPRKQIINNISRGLGLEKDQTAPVLEAAGIDARWRAQDLAVEDWARLQISLEGVKIDYA